ncbi:hypothetical protein FB558_3107 [Pseudonocardia kunmingensis]|uniref:Uncharacterized protein n=2 Tax=Pseudonocardia kunmingensis TaxID=630975 RepID=A0A543E3X8_9PSEU|nr:hypothetical protein FB558_3107 [Pseudonocardia kunmingensis]
MAFWMTTTGEGFAMGEAADEAEARRMIESQQRGSVTFDETTGRYRWTVVLDGGKTSHGYAETRDEAWWFVEEALNRPYRGTRYRGPRGRFSLPPQPRP